MQTIFSASLNLQEFLFVSTLLLVLAMIEMTSCHIFSFFNKISISKQLQK